MLKQMKKQARLYQTRFSFGASAAIITNLGLIIGLDSSPNAKFSIIAKDEEVNPLRAIAEHLGIAFVVIVLSEFVGKWLMVNFR